MRDDSPFTLFETPGTLVLFETRRKKTSASKVVRRLKMMTAALVVAGLAAVAFLGTGPPVEPDSTRWQRITEAAAGCDHLDSATGAEIQCRAQAGSTP